MSSRSWRADLALVDVDVVEVEIREARPVLVVGLDQPDRDLVDDLVRRVLLDGRLDGLALVRLDVLARTRSRGRTPGPRESRPRRSRRSTCRAGTR